VRVSIPIHHLVLPYNRVPGVLSVSIESINHFPGRVFHMWQSIKAWHLLLLLNSVEHAFGREQWVFPDWIRRLLKEHWPIDDQKFFSGHALENGNYLVLVTASFCHASRSHYVNNMIMLLVVGRQLEAAVGSAFVLLLYVLSGIAGWLLTYLRLKKIVCGPDSWVAGQFQQGVGSSPSTYALAVTTACVLGHTQAVGPLFPEGALVSEVHPLASWMSTIFAVNVFPNLSQLRFREVLFMDLPLTLLALLLHSDWVWLTTGTRWAAFHTVNSASWMILYHFKTSSNTLYRRIKHNRSMQSSDHAAHFGGALIGFAFAALHCWEKTLAIENMAAVTLSLVFLFVRFNWDI